MTEVHTSNSGDSDIGIHLLSVHCREGLKSQVLITCVSFSPAVTQVNIQELSSVYILYWNALERACLRLQYHAWNEIFQSSALNKEIGYFVKSVDQYDWKSLYNQT